MDTIKVNLTKMFSYREPWDCSNSVANLGDRAGELTWACALEVAEGLGVSTITLTAKAVGNRARTLGRLNFYVPLRRYGWAESAHQILLHYWFDEYLNRYGRGAM